MRIKNSLATCAFALGILFVGGTAASAHENNSVVDYLSAQGEDASFEHRGELAADNGIVAYKGTANQNVALLGELKGTPVAKVHKASAKPRAHHKAHHRAAHPNGRSLTVTATAYTANCYGCSGVTATGINIKKNPNKKVIAVDPKVISLGSQVYVEGYGKAVAGDTGGAIKGHRIDVFIPSKSAAVNYGKKRVKVTVLK